MAATVSGQPDLIVVGAGAGGMTAALVAALEGLKVVLLEASDQVGGTTATSAGTLWVPGNLHGQHAGHSDSLPQAVQYLNAVIGHDDDRQCRDAFFETAPLALDYLERRTQVKFTSAGRHPDYLTQPGAAISGRAVAPLPFDGRMLGSDFSRVRPPLATFMLLGGMMVGKADIQALIRRWKCWPDFLHSASLVARYAADRLRYPRGTRLVMGNALVARLFISLREVGVDIRFGCRLRSLDMQLGRASGVYFSDGEGQLQRLSATRGVVLATGGVGHDAALRRELIPEGDLIRSLVADDIRGDGLRAARIVGAALERHDTPGNLFWQPVSQVPALLGGGLFAHLFLDRAKPGLIAVNELGQRFTDESASYHHFVESMLRATGTPPRKRVWLVCDGAFVQRYGLGIIAPGTRSLDRWDKQGYIACEASLTQLARRLGIDADGLAVTVARMNDFAATGRDLDFGKGDTEVGRFNGDSTRGLNPCLGVIATTPFCALEIHPADAASSAGLATDGNGRVLSASSEPIAGLYACGNDAASIMRGSYPGPGTTLGPAIVFGYRVGRHAASGGVPADEAPQNHAAQFTRPLGQRAG
ncbi:MAG: FAD-dependent oxidoreductase [Rhodoferax sp.]|nr:FAD-dependent oxidoreductase [Rhodoferax sp.]